MKYCFGFGQTMSIIFCEKVPKYLDSINLTFKFGTTIDEIMKIYLRRITLIYFKDNEKYKISFLFNEVQYKFGDKTSF